MTDCTEWDPDQLIVEIRQLQKDFERLFLADVDGSWTIMRSEFPSRSAVLNVNRTRFPGLTDRSSICFGYIDFFGKKNQIISGAEGLFVYPPTTQTSAQEGTSKRGWSSNHSIKFAGSHLRQLLAILKRANNFVIGYQTILGSILYPGRRLYFYPCSWPDIVERIAELAHSKSFQPPMWMVMVGGSGVPISSWKRRHTLGYFLDDPTERPKHGFRFSRADEERIGDETDMYHCVRETFVRDSELALEWLAERVGDNEFLRNLGVERLVLNLKNGKSVEPPQLPNIQLSRKRDKLLRSLWERADWTISPVRAKRVDVAMDVYGDEEKAESSTIRALISELVDKCHENEVELSLNNRGDWIEIEYSPK